MTAVSTTTTTTTPPTTTMDDLPIFGAAQAEREARLVARLRELTVHHVDRCPSYANIVRTVFPQWDRPDRDPTLADLPYVPVGLFKRRDLKSVPEDEVFKVVTSSGTTGQPSRVFLDRDTAQIQARTLSAIMTHVLGKQRRPMLVVDTDAILRNPAGHTARAAGVLGMMNLGRKHVFLLDADMAERADRLAEFVADYEGEDLLIFGFTFMVWQHLQQRFGSDGIDLSRATLVHSGGWKTMEAERVGNPEFRQALGEAFGLRHIVNFYGMAEQVGSVFVEGDDGYLHPCREADVLIRHPSTLKVVPDGEVGLIQVLSTLPTSYPGHSILTEDIGVIHATDEDPLGGKAFQVLGRSRRSELRGCSDTYARATQGTPA